MSQQLGLLSVRPGSACRWGSAGRYDCTFV